MFIASVSSRPRVVTRRSSRTGRRIHQHDRVELVDEIPLEEQRNDADYDRIATLLGESYLAVPQPGHPRVHDSVQCVQLALIREDYPAERFPVEAAVLLDDFRAPALHDVPERLGFRAHRLPRQLVRVDDGGAALGQHPGDL